MIRTAEETVELAHQIRDELALVMSMSRVLSVPTLVQEVNRIEDKVRAAIGDMRETLAALEANPLTKDSPYVVHLRALLPNMDAMLCLMAEDGMDFNEPPV